MEAKKILADIQFKLLRTESIEDAYCLIANATKEVIGDGIVAAIRLNDSNNTMQFVTCAGLGPLLEKIVGVFGKDPTKEAKRIEEMSKEEYRRYSSGTLELVPGGIFELMSGHAPKAVCDAAQKLMHVKNVYSIGVIQGESPLGGLIILARNDIDSHKTDIENIVNQAAFIIQRKKAEENLKKSELRNMHILDTSMDGFCRHDMDGKFIEVNSTYCRMSGYSKEELLSMCISDIEATLAPQKIKEKIQHARDNGSIRLETKHRRKDGTVFDVEVSSRYLHGEEQECFAAFYHDISERKQAEVALRESEERFRSTFEQAAVGIAQVDLDGRWLRVNQRICEILGYKREELLPLTFQDITHPDDLNTDLDYVRQVLANKIKTYSMEKRYIRKDHSTVWANLTVGLVRDEAAAPKYFVSVIEDITERKLAEEALLESEQKLRVSEGLFKHFMYHSPSLIYMKDDKLRLLKISKKLEELLGRPESELIGKDSYEHVPPEFAKNAIADDMKVLKEGLTVDNEEEINGKIYATTIFPIRVDNDKNWVFT